MAKERLLVKKLFKELSAKGFRVTRSYPGNAAGLPDIEAYKMPVLFGVECKSVNKYLSNAQYVNDILKPSVLKSLQRFHGERIVHAGGIFVVAATFRDKFAAVVFSATPPSNPLAQCAVIADTVDDLVKLAFLDTYYQARAFK